MAIHNIEALKRAYFDFRRNAMANFIVDIRRTRAQQIRAMTTDPDTLPDIETYEREIWRLESRTYLRSRHLELRIFFKYYEQTLLQRAMSEHHLSLGNLHEALHTGDLELQGNYNFGQTSAIFAPMLREQHTRFSLVKQALHHLHNPTLTPQQKVEQVLNTKGFGENNATGLGMIFHPEDIGIVNSATREHLQQMGHTAASTQSWQQLQDVLRSLHTLLKTRDFIELDWFIYLHGTHLAQQQNGSESDYRQHQFSNPIPKREAGTVMVSDNPKRNLNIIDLSIKAAREIEANLHPVTMSDLHAAYMRANPGITKGITQDSFAATINYHTINMRSRFPDRNQKRKPASWLTRPVFKRVGYGKYMLLSPDELALFHQHVEDGDPRIYEDEYDIKNLFNIPEQKS